ncbi:MAG: hypothetical protein DLM73_17520 [Chthoniobacterales bacterium]|nr:MAG: hypothetical protein DLM73_17520 [Chthoniobacterales bacterium]
MVLECGKFSQHASITAVPNRVEIVRIIFGEKRVARAQSGIMNSEMPLQDLPPVAQGMEAFHGRGAAAIVPAQIWPGLFALEDCSHGCFFRAGSVRRHVCAITALRQTHFRSAGGIAIGLSPNQGEPFQTKVRFGFAATNS